jgi:RNase P/RNase MRP subunit p29
MIFIMGEDVRVAAARDAMLLGLRGKVVLETMNTLTIKSGERKVVLPKAGTAIELLSGEVVLGDDVRGRIEDRISLAGRRRSR